MKELDDVLTQLAVSLLHPAQFSEVMVTFLTELCPSGPNAGSS